MSTFDGAIERIAKLLEKRSREIMSGAVDLAHESIQTGSPVTGAPGQPVDRGGLRISWQKWYPSPDTAVIGTNSPYAASIEDGISYAHGGTPMTLRSPTGGFHSVKLTVASWQRIVDNAVRATRGR